MKFSTSVIAGVALANSAAAHYFFDKLVIDGVESNSMQYVRENTRNEKYNPTKWKNIRDDMTPDLPDFRCNKGAFESAGRTQTAEVKAGAKLAMKLAVGATMQHPGPQMVYMSKAPDAVSSYEGDGDWFKIMEAGVCDESKDFLKEAWCSWDKDRIEFTIPEGTPDGEYLIRPEHIGLHGAHGGEAEFYYGCAQVKVTGGGSGIPGPTAKIPGIYNVNDPEVNFNLWGGFQPYTIPGPALWDGGSSGGAAAGNGAAAPDNTTTPELEQNELPPTTVPSTEAPVASAAAVHSAENCNGGKLARTRRAFREMLQKL